MCGLVGLWKLSGDLDETVTTVREMSDALKHRGPDDFGIWQDPVTRIVLGHQRLSILDLSDAGHQPMLSASGRFVIAFNGEIYNHYEIRKELEQLRGAGELAWRGHSDTETILAALEEWGVERALRKTVGMFSIALWDKLEGTLTLARDRFGEKPLYYGWLNNDFVFCSELKALKRVPGFSNTINREALSDYLRYSYIPAPCSIYEGVYKLEPGSLVTLQAKENNIEITRRTYYWSIEEAVTEGCEFAWDNEEAALLDLESALTRSVHGQMLSDVPLGAFLSGGIDSSLIVSLMQKVAEKPVKTFTVGFDEAGFDESPHAMAVARHLGTDHTEVRVTAAETLETVPILSDVYDEPFADSSQIPTHIVSRVARQRVKVALSGDGGDELFGGYNRYYWGPKVWARVRHIPYPLRQIMAAIMMRVPPTYWNAFLDRAGQVRPGEKVAKLGRALKGASSIDDLYRNLLVEWPADVSLVNGADKSGVAFHQSRKIGHLDDARARMMARDSVDYLPDDILCKVDRAAMSVSLETRAPYLDHRVADLAWRLPMSMKIRDNQGKWALKQVLYKYVPPRLIERPKAGFAIPVGQWLRGPLRPWAEALLDESRMRRDGYLKAEPIRESWWQHSSGRHDWTNRLWAILMFQSWLERQSN